MIELRRYQLDVIEKTRSAITSGKKSIIIQATCGAGKTCISAGIASMTIAKGNRFLFIAPRRELVFQAKERFEAYGLGEEIGIIMAGEESCAYKPIQIVSPWTYVRRLRLDNTTYPWFHDADVICVDECHSSLCSTLIEILENYKDKKIIIGLSATPTKASGEAMSNLYEEIISAVPVHQLIKEGYLVPAVHYSSPEKVNLKGVRIVAGEYHKGDAEERFNTKTLVGDIFSNWARIAGGTQTIIFAQGVKHSKHIRDVFMKNGVSISHLDAHTPDQDRDEMLKKFAAREIQVITNVRILDQGYDCPSVETVVLATSKKSIGGYLQMGGRALRPFPGKTNAIIIDHGNNVLEHGFVTDEYTWTLSGKGLACKPKVRRKKEKKILECQECRTLFVGNKCTSCGTIVPDYGKKIETTDDDLQQVGEGKKKATTEEKRRFYQMLKFYADQNINGNKSGWAKHKFKDRYGCWPNYYDKDPPLQPDYEFERYMKHLWIKWSKSKKKQERSDGLRQDQGEGQGAMA